jgi:hypothetical protein
MTSLAARGDVPGVNFASDNAKIWNGIRAERFATSYSIKGSTLRSYQREYNRGVGEGIQALEE